MIYTLKNDRENLIRPQQWTIENESEEIGRMADENKVVPLETLVINKEEFEQLFLDFFVQYDRIYDFSSSLDLFEIDIDYYQPQEVFRLFRDQIIGISQTTK